MSYVVERASSKCLENGICLKLLANSSSQLHRWDVSAIDRGQRPSYSFTLCSAQLITKAISHSSLLVQGATKACGCLAHSRYIFCVHRTGQAHLAGQLTLGGQLGSWRARLRHVFEQGRQHVLQSVVWLYSQSPFFTMSSSKNQNRAQVPVCRAGQAHLPGWLLL